MIFGAAIAHLVKNIWLAIILSVLGHYFLDLIPHVDYPLKDVDENRRRKLSFGFIKVALDISVGILLILIFSSFQPITYICVFFSILPDGLTVLKYIFPGNKILEGHYWFHQKIHFLKHKKISNFWRITTQIVVVLVSITILRF
jgi:hypothetical protein